MTDGVMLGIPLLVTSIISVDLAILAWRRSELPSKRPYILMTVSVALLALSYLMELMARDLPSMLFWNNIEYVAVVMLPPLFLLFTLHFLGKGTVLNWKTLVLLFTMSVMTMAFLWTNDYHHLFYRSVELIGDGNMTSFVATYGPLFYILAAYCLAIVTASFMILLSAFLGSPRVYRSQIRLVMIGGALPMVAILVSPFLQFPLNLTMLLVLSFLGAAVFTFMGSFRYEILDVMPLALDSIIERMTDGVMVIDRKYRVVYANPSASRALGRSTSDIHLHPLADLMPELTSEELQQAIKEGRAIELSISKLGADKVYDIRASELRDQAGMRNAFILTFRDVTEETEMRESLKRVNTRINVMSTVTRHTTLDQIGVIRGYSEILSSSRQSEANVRRYAERIKDAVKYIEHQVNLAVEYQRLGSSEPQWQWAQYVLAKAKTTGVAEGLQVESELGTLTVLADPLLEKAFTILLDNTRRHAKGDKRVKVSYRIEDRTCIITYQDEGPGIPLLKKEEVFTRREAGSGGLGLFVARQIMEMAGESIREVGSEGQGAKFELVFPEGTWSEDRIDNLRKVGMARSAA